MVKGILRSERILFLSSRQDEARDERQRQLTFLHVSYVSYNGVLLSGAVEVDVVMARPTLKMGLTRRARDEEMHFEHGIIAFCEVC
jgi:hypothetical protein